MDVTIETHARTTAPTLHNAEQVPGVAVEDRLVLVVEDTVITLHHARSKTKSSIGCQLKLSDVELTHSVRTSTLMETHAHQHSHHHHDHHSHHHHHHAHSWRASVGDGRLLVVRAQDDSVLDTAATSPEQSATDGLVPTGPMTGALFVSLTVRVICSTLFCPCTTIFFLRFSFL